MNENPELDTFQELIFQKAAKGIKASKRMRPILMAMLPNLEIATLPVSEAFDRPARRMMVVRDMQQAVRNIGAVAVAFASESWTTVESTGKPLVRPSLNPKRISTLIISIETATRQEIYQSVIYEKANPRSLGPRELLNPDGVITHSRIRFLNHSNEASP